MAVPPGPVTLHVDFISQPSRACIIFCRQVVLGRLAAAARGEDWRRQGAQSGQMSCAMMWPEAARHEACDISLLDELARGSRVFGQVHHLVGVVSCRGSSSLRTGARVHVRGRLGFLLPISTSGQTGVLISLQGIATPTRGPTWVPAVLCTTAHLVP